MIWLAQPTRFAGVSRDRARIGLVLLALLMIACLCTLITVHAGARGTAGGRGVGDAGVVLYDGIVDDIRHGGNYYSVAAEELREGGYPMTPFVTFRLPTLAVVQAMLPPWGVIALLYVLVAATAAAWFVRLRGVFARASPLAFALILLAGGMGVFVQAELTALHEIWAGLLIALSLALRRPGHWIAATGIGALAMLVRETAVLYVAVMAILAWIEGDRREAIGWAAAVALLALVLAAHAQAVALMVKPLDPTWADFSGMPGPGLFLEAITLTTMLRLAPMWLAAVLMALTLFGWAAWRDATGLRALITFSVYAVSSSLFGSGDAFYCALMVAPVILVGLVFAPDGLRDLFVAAFPQTRNATGTRLT